ncbi:serine/threonine protein kinase [Comamonas sp. CMM03]|uniref:serine/threonine protein kinase n=1 Tax=Comamonas sp. CMM03 TaxID=2854781 RepID=UPI001C49015F|nr:serine/threonine protein kinase [Comamonas sp. CMM03]MBV7420717.1 serine/threonine protein kinase [Comamonas sp. CMM03]
MSTTESTHPYAQLTPDCVLDALSGTGLWPDGRLQALGSYENRVYQACLDDGSKVVAKFYRPGRWTAAQIAEEHDFSRQLVQAEVPVVAPLELQGRTVHQHAGFAFSVSPWRGGRTPELDDWDTLEWIGRFLARLHSVGAQQDFVHRPTLDAQQMGAAPLQWLLAHGDIPPHVRPRWQAACEAALAMARDALAQTPVRAIRLHGDCHPGNILWTPVDDNGQGGPHFVDLDDARMGPAVQDLWMLLSGDRRQRSQQLSTLVEGYEQLRDFDRRELRLIEPLRTLRLIHYSAWLAQRWQDPAFPRAFPWFGTEAYWLEQTSILLSQVLTMEEEPLAI